jgi:hypothetical protein
MKTDIHFRSYLVQLFLEREMFQIKAVGEIKIHILCSVTFFSEMLPFMRIRGNILYSVAGHRSCVACTLRAG